MQGGFMQKINITRIGVFVVSCGALTALLANQSALAQERARLSSGVTLIGTKRVRPSDPSFRWSIAAVLDPIRDKIAGHKIDMDMQGAFVWSETIHHTTSGDSEWFTRTIFWFAPDKVGQVRQMTPAQFAIAETLFKDINLGRARNLVVTKNGITGSVTNKELGVRAGQLTSMTKKRLQGEINAAQSALKGVGQ
jgi:hypothetical protein